MKSIDEIRAALEAEKPSSAWGRGVQAYAAELLEELEEAAAGDYESLEKITTGAELEKALLNGAQNWSDYSWGGSALIYDGDIAVRLCNPSELKKTRNGERRPNSREEWLDAQARALFQASNRLRRLAF